MNEDNGIKPIDSKFLDSGDLFALKFQEGYVFLSVENREIAKYRPYSNLEDLGSQSNLSSGQQRLDEPNDSDDILYVPSDDDLTVIHTGIGIKPHFIRMYTRYPEEEGILGTIPNLAAPSSRAGDPYGYVDGYDSPYDQPTDALELWIPPKSHLSFDFYNPDVDQHEPILNIRMAEYKVNLVDPRSDIDVARRVLSPGSPMPVNPVGTVDKQVTFRLQNEWGVTPMSRTQVMGGN